MTKVKLGSILLEQKKSVKSPDGNGMDLIGVSNEIGLHVSRAKRIDDLSRYKIIEMGWFAYNPMRVNVGSIGYVYKQVQIGIVSPDYVVFSCSDKILPEYLLYLLKSDEGIEEINRNASGAVRKRLYFSDLARIEIVLPSIECQRRRLVAFRKIKDLGFQISEHRSAGSLLSQLKQSILQEAIQGQLTEDWRAKRALSGAKVEPASELLKRIKAEKAQLIKDKKIKKEKALPPITEEEIPFELPEGWVWCRLGDIFSTTSGGTPTKGNHRYWKGEITWYKSGELNDSYLDIESHEKITQTGLKESSATLFPKGTLLIAMYGATAGKLAILGREATTNQAVCGFFENGNILTAYLFDFLLSNRTKMIKESWGMSQPNISQTYLRNFAFALPPFEEQKAIVEKVKTLIQKCQALEQEIKTSEANAQMLMQAVLKDAFEGKPEVVGV